MAGVVVVVVVEESSSRHLPNQPLVVQVVVVGSLDVAVVVVSVFVFVVVVVVLSLHPNQPGFESQQCMHNE